MNMKINDFSMDEFEMRTVSASLETFREILR